MNYDVNFEPRTIIVKKKIIINYCTIYYEETRRRVKVRNEITRNGKNRSNSKLIYGSTFGPLFLLHEEFTV